MSQFKKNFSSHRHNKQANTSAFQSWKFDNHEDEITVQEVELAIMKLKFGKAGGADSVTTEYFKYGCYLSILWVKKAFNTVMIQLETILP